ncbi:MAG: hypothetical protein ACRCUT_07180, partial [Spirochaetota bacterium]
MRQKAAAFLLILFFSLSFAEAHARKIINPNSVNAEPGVIIAWGELGKMTYPGGGISLSVTRTGIISRNTILGI